jgi:uncharacterized protein YutE (UPF0331/DUF86 family)
MPEFRYAKGRIGESLQFISQEMIEFDDEYANKTWNDYTRDRKLQKLMDRTVENILTALIEVSGSILTEEGIAVESYSDALKRCAELCGLDGDEQEYIAKLAVQRNRFAQRHLNFKWQAITVYKDQRNLIQRMAMFILKREEG